MRSRLVLGVILTVLLGVTGGGNSAFSDQASNTPIPDDPIGACTSFCLDNGDHCVYGANMDHTVQVGQLYVNKRHIFKTAWEASRSGEYARWISKYGSVTLNFVGSQLAWGGMNEAGLMVATVSLAETSEPEPDERPPLAAAFWLQYQLDTASTVEEVIASDQKVRVTDAYDHYLICDGQGTCAVIEFLDGEMVTYSGSLLPVQALTNSTYQDSLSALQDGRTWKMEATHVEEGGPAAEAGLMEGDWITALDGVVLDDAQSMEAYYAAIAKHEPGDTVPLSVRRSGESISIEIEMASLPEDLDRYVLPPGVPVQVLSLGFFASHPGDFLSRFATAAEWVDAYEAAGGVGAVAYAFDALEAVSRSDTVWSAVMDPIDGRLYLHTMENSRLRYVDLDDLDFSCHSPAKMSDVHAVGSGDISGELGDYSHEMARDHGLYMATTMWQVDASPLYVETLLAGFESFRCMESNPVAMDTPVQYAADHPPLFPPLVTWAGLLVIHRSWPIWALLTLLSFVLLLRCMARGRETSRRSWLVWITATVLLGPIGLLAYCLVARRQ